MKIHYKDFNNVTTKIPKKVGVVYIDNRYICVGQGIHAMIHDNYFNFLNEERKKNNLPPLSLKKFEKIRKNSSPIFWGDTVYIRPENIKHALTADKLLRDRDFEFFKTKHKVRFMWASNPDVRKALLDLGEAYRLNYPPRTSSAIEEFILNSKVAIKNVPIYYYCKEMGTRYLSFDEFQKLDKLDDEKLFLTLDEIRNYSGLKNSLDCPEIDFFMIDRKKFSNSNFTNISRENIRRQYSDILTQFKNAVKTNFQKDDVKNIDWRNTMLNLLTNNFDGEDNEKREEDYVNLSPEYSKRVLWLPGARISDRKIIYDSNYEEKTFEKDSELERLCSHEEIVKGLIRSKEQDILKGKIKSINIAYVPESLSKRIIKPGRREVFLMEIGYKNKSEVRVIRMQKQGMKEFLEQGYDYEESMLLSEDRAKYIVDRNKACRVLGMNLFPGEFLSGKLEETFQEKKISSHYYDRQYIFGEATDKLEQEIYHIKYGNKRFSNEFARLLGVAAACNMILGRCDESKAVFFDDGDEILQLDVNGMPKQIIVSDFTGSFNDCDSPLERFSVSYALPINLRFKTMNIPAKKEFISSYCNGFLFNFLKIQDSFKNNSSKYKNYFKNRNYIRDDCNLELKWNKVLERLSSTDPYKIVREIENYVD